MWRDADVFAENLTRAHHKGQFVKNRLPAIAAVKLDRAA
jgi:hypothetical protein